MGDGVHGQSRTKRREGQAMEEGAVAEERERKRERGKPEGESEERGGGDTQRGGRSAEDSGGPNRSACCLRACADHEQLQTRGASGRPARFLAVAISSWPRHKRLDCFLNSAAAGSERSRPVRASGKRVEGRGRRQSRTGPGRDAKGENG